MRRLVLLLALGACVSEGRLEPDLVFAQYVPLSRNDEVARRTLPPLTFRRMNQTLAAQHRQLAAQAIDLAHERFDVYVPPGPPPRDGYGLLVFVAPWPDPTRPRVWRPALDDHHFVFVSAQRAGNGTSILDRRLPLALLAYANVRTRLAIDASRVYVMGFSGGSRVAEIAALAYPDVFRGAVLNAGADPIDGQLGIFKPPAELFHAFQHSRLVFITGDNDRDNVHQDDVTQASLRDACVLDVETVLAPRLAHEPLDALAFGRALDALERPRAVDAAELARCNARVDHAIAAALADAEATIARGDRTAARSKLDAIDARFGGLAAPAIVELETRLAAQP